VVTRSTGTGTDGFSSWRPLYITIHAVDQGFVGRSEVRTAARCRIVSGACRGRTRVKVSGAGKGLTDDSRADQLAILFDELAIGAIAKEKLCEPGNAQRIDHAKQDGGDQGKQDGDDQIFFTFVS